MAEESPTRQTGQAKAFKKEQVGVTRQMQAKDELCVEVEVGQGWETMQRATCQQCDLLQARLGMT